MRVQFEKLPCYVDKSKGFYNFNKVFCYPRARQPQRIMQSLRRQ
jgi:hypothetical protein